MYQISPIQTKQGIDLPSCMYKIQPVNMTLHSDNQDSSGKSNKSDLELLEEKQNRILKKLEELKQTLLSMRSECQSKSSQKPSSLQKATTSTAAATKKSVDLSHCKEVVINVHPADVPYSILALKTLWKDLVNIEVVVFTHSSIKESDFSQAAKEFSEFSSKVTSPASKNNLPTLKLTIIWKNVAVPQFLVSAAKFVPLLGEANIIRFFNRVGPSESCYEKEIHFANQADSVLDICQLLSMKPSKGERQGLANSLSQKLGKSQYFLNSKDISVADIAVLTTLKNVYSNNVKELPANLSNWLQKTSKSLGC